MHINDIGENILSLTRLFADDTSLGYSSTNKDDIEAIINRDLKELHIWAKKWLMSFNPEKTEIMIFSNNDFPNDFNFMFEDKVLPITTSHKHLGVTFSSDAK